MRKRSVLEIYEPPLCCPGGVCKGGVDTSLVEIFEALSRLTKEHGGEVEVRRFVLPADLRRVRGDEAHRARLMEWQAQRLFPVTCVDGRVVKTGAYPTYEEMVSFVL